MNLIHTIVRVLPFWAIPLAIIFGESARIMRKRRTSEALQYLFWMLSGGLLFITALWFLMRGDRNSDQFVRDMFS